MAREELKEYCEDAISRKAVIEHICEGKDCYKKNCKGILYNRCSDIEWVNELPSLIPTRKVGKWTPGEPICPCCGEDKFKDLDADIWSDWLPKYCPNCGAKMES